MDTKETPHTAHHEEGATEGEQIEMIPGTEVMTDVEEKHLAHAHNTASSAILIPQPTNDPHDPLVRAGNQNGSHSLSLTCA
jgi:hypothetical protein